MSEEETPKPAAVPAAATEVRIGFRRVTIGQGAIFLTIVSAAVSAALYVNNMRGDIMVLQNTIGNLQQTLAADKTEENEKIASLKADQDEKIKELSENEHQLWQRVGSNNGH